MSQKMSNEGKSFVDELAKLKVKINLLRKMHLKATSEEEASNIAGELMQSEQDYAELLELSGFVGEEPTIGQIRDRAKVRLNKTRTSETPRLIDSIAEENIDLELERDPDDIVGVDEPRLTFDFLYFCENALEIVYRPGMNKDQPLGGFGPMVITDAQKSVIAFFLHVLFTLNEPLRAQMLKSRQLGNTTLLLAFAVWLMQTNPHYHVMIIIDKDAHARTKRDMVRNWLIRMSKFSCFSGIAKGGTDDKMLRLENGSMIFFESSQSPNPGTSEMIHFLIESEKPKWVAGRAKQIRNSVTPGLPFAPKTIHIDESTAMGQEDFYVSWKRLEADPTAIMKPIFLPWTFSREYRMVPPPISFDQSGNFIYADKDPELFDFDTDSDKEICESEYAKKYNLDHDQVYWRRTKIKIQFQGNRSGFDQEYPTTPDHAFRATQFGFFSKRLRDKISKMGVTPQRYDIIDMSGYADQTRPVPYTMLRPRMLKRQGGHLFVGEHPIKDHQYFIGADVAEGKVVEDESGKDDPDYTVFSVKNSYGKTVAMYICRERPEEAWYPLLLLALYYNDAYVNCERNNAGGTLLANLWLTSYYRIFIDPKPKSRPPRDRAGTAVTQANRDFLLRQLRTSYINDPDRIFAFTNHAETMLKQTTAFIVNTLTGKAEAAPGFHDDLIFAEMHAEHARVVILGEETARALQSEEGPAIVEYVAGSIEDTDMFSDPMFDPDEMFSEDPEYFEFDI